MIEIGQILSFKFYYDTNNTIPATKHPYLIIDINSECVTIAQLDSLAGKERKAAFKGNKVIFKTNPEETVIDRDSYIRLDNLYTVEFCQTLTKYRRQTDKLSEWKLNDVILAYKKYHESTRIIEEKIVFMSIKELHELNR